MRPDKYLKNYLAGVLAPAESNAVLETINPATGQVYASFPDSGQADINRALEAAIKAFPAWTQLEKDKRFRILMRLADILEQEAEVLARAEATDTGKPFSMALSADIPQAVQCLRFYASSVLHHKEAAYHEPGYSVHYRLRRARGVVACFGHWDYPLLRLCQWVAPALAAGNTVLYMPAEETPMTAYLFAQACVEAGLPAGVLNILLGKRSYLLEAVGPQAEVRAIALQGQLAEGRQLRQQYQDTFTPLLLDVGGKNAAILFADGNIDQMIVGVLRSCFSNNGQNPFATSRLYVEREIFSEVRDELVKRSQFLKIGDPFSSVTDLGAMISEAQLENVLNKLSLLELDGGNLLSGGNRLELNGEQEHGFFLRPAVVEGLAPESSLNQEELLAPVVTIAPFDTEEQAIELANHSAYGRAAVVWTSDGKRANRLAEQLRAGLVWVNGWMLPEPRRSYYAGGYAGECQLGGMASLHFFTEEKTVGYPY